jgi:hypothetical protein
LEVVAAASQNQCRSRCHAYTTKPAHSFFLIGTQIKGGRSGFLNFRSVKDKAAC